MYDAMIISDLHIGAHNCQRESILEFLEKVKNKTPTKKLIIAGDLFDSFGIRLQKIEWKILGTIRALSNDIEMIWVKGNHDTHAEAETVSNLIGAEFCPIHYIFESGEKKIVITHGDAFDDFLSDHPILTNISDWIYGFLQKIDKNHRIAKFAKQQSKQYLHCSEAVAMSAKAYAKKLKCDLICCGHTHFALNRDNYYNSGTWTEIPCSYLSIKSGVIKIVEWVSYDS